MRQLWNDFPLVVFAVFGAAWLTYGLWTYGSLVSVPLVVLTALLTIALPVIIGCASAGRFRLWHIFVWITLFVAVLAWIAQQQRTARKTPNRPSAAGLNS